MNGRNLISDRRIGEPTPMAMMTNLATTQKAVTLKDSKDSRVF
jgi:hypothetical protein